MAIGRPPITLNKEKIIELYLKGLSSFKIAKLFDVSWTTITRRLKEYGVPIRRQYPAWNKGLTVLTDNRVLRNSEKTSRMSGKKHTPESKAKMSESHKGQNTWSKGRKLSEEHIAKIGEASKRHWEKPEYRAKQIQKMKERWANPEYRNKVLPLIVKSNRIKPSQPEQRLIDIINKAQLPFKYTGDGSFIIQGVNPDFINCDGAKIVIEVFGDYWHGKHARTWKETELGRIMAFNSFGFRCIILWESEINNSRDEIIIERIKNESARLSCMHGARFKREKRA